jgi:Zn-dependent protease/CBS domain-containing protein
MNWSFRIADVGGIAIKIHATFFLIVALGALQWGMLHGATGALFGALLILLLFVCVTLHELGHALAARWFNVPVREIVLLPLGGVALLERQPSRPLHELVIALAGPAVNVLIAAVLALGTGAAVAFGGLDARGLIPGQPMAPSLATMTYWLLEANISLVLFNLIPAFPLDGGRVLRALLALRLDFARATTIAAGIGQALAVVLGVVGIVSGNLLLALVAVFIFFGAGQEQAASQARGVLAAWRAGETYNKHALTLAIGDRVSTVVDYLLTSYQSDFAVLQGQRPIGIVSRDEVLRALASDERDRYVQEIMRREIVAVSSAASLDEVQQTMVERQTRVVAVYDGERYLGLLSLEDLAEAYVVIASQQRQRPRQDAAVTGGRV